jgi:hypothetical protein
VRSNAAQLAQKRLRADVPAIEDVLGDLAEIRQLRQARWLRSANPRERELSRISA